MPSFYPLRLLLFPAEGTHPYPDQTRHLGFPLLRSCGSARSVPIGYERNNRLHPSFVRRPRSARHLLIKSRSCVIVRWNERGVVCFVCAVSEALVRRASFDKACSHSGLSQGRSSVSSHCVLSVPSSFPPIHKTADPVPVSRLCLFPYAAPSGRHHAVGMGISNRWPSISLSL